MSKATLTPEQEVARLKAQIAQLETAKGKAVNPSNKPEGKNASKGKGKAGAYHLADGTESRTFLVPVTPENAGVWHYYSPRKEVVVHGASYTFCAGLLKAQYGVDAPQGPIGPKMRFWFTLPVANKGLGKGVKMPETHSPKAMPTWSNGIVSIKSWAVKAQQQVEVSTAKPVKRSKPKTASPVKQLVKDGKPVTQEGKALLQVAETQMPYIAPSVVDAARQRAEAFVAQQDAQDAAISKAVAETVNP